MTDGKKDETSQGNPGDQATTPQPGLPGDQRVSPSSETSGETIAADWSPEDEVWVAGVPEALRGVARRHGKELFQITMQTGAANHALGILSRQLAGNRGGGQALHVLSKVLNDLCIRAVKATGKPAGALTECHMDVERVSALADTGQALPDGARVSKGGIILNS